MPLLTDNRCDCPWPYLWEIYNPFAGRMTRMRLCCINKFLEQMYEISFLEVVDSEPLVSWNSKLAGEMPNFLRRIIEEKKAQGFKMEAPLETQDFRAQMRQTAGSETTMTVSEEYEQRLREAQPVENGHRKAWVRDGRLPSDPGY